jgi:hypothetical protein
MELKIKKETAKEIYDESPAGLKKILEETFGIDHFKKSDYRDFQTFYDLCRAIGTTEAEFNMKWDSAVFDPSTIAFERLKVCIRAYNQDWPYDTYNTNQYKYYPYFEVLSSGLGFSSSVCSYGNAHTCVGSRLCFESSDKAIHAGKTFIKLFEEFITAKF